MTTVQTDLRNTLESARRIRYEPTASIPATNVQTAIEQAVSTPPTIAATTVNFAASPYQVLPTDFILEVDTSGGVVQITPQAVATRTKPLEIKDVSGNAFANNIQILGTIEGQTPYLINADFGSVTIRPNKAASAYEVTSW